MSNFKKQNHENFYYCINAFGPFIEGAGKNPTLLKQMLPRTPFGI